MNTEISTKNKQIIGKAAAVYGTLAAFGVGYNALTSWLEEQGYDEGYTSDLVIGGVLVTVLGTAPLVGGKRAALVLGGFVASGLPMVIGARLRYRKWRNREREGYVKHTTEPTPAAGQRPAQET